MKNLKKLLSVVIAVALLVTAMIPATAASKFTYEAQANALHDLGLYAGVSTSSFVPALDQKLTREQGVALLVRFMGADKEAQALTDAQADIELSFFTDKNKISPWAKKQIAYALQKKWVSGFPDGSFQPQADLTGKQLATMYIVGMGYTPDSTIYQSAVYFLASKSTAIGGVTLAQASAWNDKVMTRDDAVGFAFAMLSAKTNAGKTLVSLLIEKNAITVEQAIEAGAYGQDFYDIAEAAVNEYAAIDASKLTTVEACLETETALNAATEAVANVTHTASKAALEQKINNQKAAIDAIKAILEAAENEAKETLEAAKKAVEEYEAITDYANADELKTAAVLAVSRISDNELRTSYMDRINAKSSDISAIIAASSAVDAYIAAPYNTAAEINVAENLEKTASEKIALVKNETAAAELNKKLADHKALVDAKKALVSPAKVTAVANDLKSITLTFDKAMSINDTTVANNIKLFNLNTNAPILFNTKQNTGVNYNTGYNVSSDKKVLTLVMNDKLPQTTNVKVVVSGLLDTNNVACYYEQTITVVDMNNPQISVSSANSDSIQIVSSEPIEIADGLSTLFNGSNVNVPLIKIDGQPVIGSLKVNVAAKTIDVALTYPLNNGAHTVDIAGFRDYAGFASNAVEGYTFTTTADVTAPSIVSATVISNNQLVIKFSENIANGSSPYGLGTFTVTQVGDSIVRSISSADNNASNTYFSNVEYKDDTVTLTLANGYQFNYGATVGVTLTVTGISDSRQNRIGVPAVSITTRAEDSTTVPEIVGQPVVEKDPVRGIDNTIKLVFSKQVNKDTIRFLDKNNALISSVNYILEDYDTANPDGMTFRFIHKDITGFQTDASVTPATTDAATFKFTVTGARDLSIRQNVMADATFTVVTNDNKAPAIIYASKTAGENQTAGAGSDYVMTVYFSEPINEADAKTITNYMLGDTSTAWSKPLSAISGITSSNITTITNSASKVYGVRITIPRGTEADNLWGKASQYIFVTAKDLAGNILPVNARGGMQNGIALVNPENDTLSFTNEAITAKAIASDVVRISIAGAYNSDSLKYFFSDVNMNSFAFIDAATGDTIDLGIISATLSSDLQKIDIRIAKKLNADGTYTEGSSTYSLAVKTVNNLTKNQFGAPLTVGYNVVLAGTTPKGTAAGTTLANATVADGIAPTVKSVDKSGITGLTFNSNGIATNNMAAGSYITIVFSENIVSYTGIASDLSGVFTVRLGNSTLRPYVDYTTSITDNKIILTLKNNGLKAKDNMILQDLSNIVVSYNTANAYMIVDATSGNAAVLQ